MICGVCVLFMKYNQDSPFAYIRWLGPAHGPILRFTAIACFVAGAVLVRCGLSTPDQSLNLYRSKAVAISSRKLSACFESISCLGADVGLRIDVERKGPPSKTTYIYDIPTVYLLYVLLAIVVIVAAAVIAIIRMLWATAPSHTY
jgi:hypothetical protein